MRDPGLLGPYIGVLLVPERQLIGYPMSTPNLPTGDSELADELVLTPACAQKVSFRLKGLEAPGHPTT